MTQRLLIHGAGTIVTGQLESCRAPGDAVLIQDGHIAAIGSLADVHPGGDPPAIDIGGATLAPGLIDPHTHPVIGEWSPRQGTVGWISNYLHGGVTTLISAGETHWPGRPNTAEGLKAVAIAAAQSSAGSRPGGARLIGGALILAPGLTEADLDQLHAAGVRLVAEVGIGPLTDLSTAERLTKLAQDRGWVVPLHVGGASVPGSRVIDAAVAVAIQPDVASHVNGGPTARPTAEVETILDGTNAAVEVVQAGNVRALVDAIRVVRAKGLVDRLQIGTDTPSGTGVIPLGMLRTLAYCSALGGLEPDSALCCATGQTAARYHLDQGQLTVGAPADLIALDAPVGGVADTALDALRQGDTPAISLVVVQGEAKVLRSRVTPPARHDAVVHPGRTPEN